MLPVAGKPAGERTFWRLVDLGFRAGTDPATGLRAGAWPTMWLYFLDGDAQLEFMDTGGPLKAKKKVITATPVVEVKPQAGRGAPAVGASTVVTPQRSLAGFVAAHHALSAMLPKPVQSMLPRVDPNSPVLPKRCDYEALLRWLKLPRFGVHDTAHNWIDFFAPRLPATKHLVVDRLTELVEFGAEPQNRQVDLFFAWWELEFMHQEKQRKMPIIPREPDDAVLVLTSDQLLRLGQYPKVMESLSRFREGAARLKIGGWNQRSAMSLLGYAVGSSGPTKDRRHAALEACMVLQDGFLPESQRHFWGARGTRRRARAIGKMIQLFISLSERRTHGDWSKACADWRSDLAWVQATWITPPVSVPVTPY